MNTTTFERSIIILAAMATIVSAILTCQQIIFASSKPPLNEVIEPCKK